jgi:ABC-type uncharacterized transport system substrate-binding protein
MIRTSLFILGAVAAVAASVRTASAHPHLWIDAAGTILFDKDKVTAIRFQWTFDEFFSAGVIGEFDKNNNKQFDTDEIEPLRAGAFDGTKEVGFFTDIRIGDEKFAIETTRDFTARIEKGVAVYEFTVPLAEPVEPAQKPLTVSVYDQSYFVDIAFQGQDPIKLTGDGGAKCTIQIADDRSNPIYGGVIYPKKASLQCPPAR